MILVELPQQLSHFPFHRNLSSDKCTTYIFTRHKGDLGVVSIRKTVLPGMAIPMLKIRRPNGRLIFNMEIAIHR